MRRKVIGLAMAAAAVVAGAYQFRGRRPARKVKPTELRHWVKGLREIYSSATRRHSVLTNRRGKPWTVI